MSSFSPFPGSSPFSSGAGSPFGLPAPRRTEEESVTTVTPLGVAARVDLLPEAVAAADRLRRVRLSLVGVVAVLAVALGGAYVVVHGEASEAQEDLAAEQAQSTRLQAAQERYAQVPALLSAIDQVTAARAQAMSTDVLWYRYLADLSQRIPDGVGVDALSVTMADAATSATSATSTSETSAPATSEGVAATRTSLGAVTLTTTGRVQPDAADLLDVLSATPGLGDAWVDSSTRSAGEDGGAVTISSRADVTTDALSHRYDETGG